MTVYLSKQDLAVLAAFKDGKDHSSYHVADRLELPPHAVRSSVQQLRYSGLVRRSGGLMVGRHYITDAGIRRLAEEQQLRLIK